jgi:hypothetical protein
MKRLLLGLIAVLISTGCMPRQPGVVELDNIPQQRAFFHFIDAETSGERKQALHALQHDFPESPLTARAVELNKQDADRLEQKTKNKKLTSQLNRCRETDTQRETENDALRKDLEQLKQLLIEMEMRAR